jgi:hypothetical protein
MRWYLALWIAGALVAGCDSTGDRKPKSVATAVEPELDLARSTALVLSDARARGTPRFKRGSFTRTAPGAGLDTAVLVVRGARDLVLDLQGVELRGAPLGSDLDRASGVGILIEDSENVTLRGAKLGGFKVCVLARRSKDLVFEDLQFEGWYGMRLASTSVAENELDWLYPHENDADQWNTNYGAALALDDCEHAIVRSARGRKGQNGVLLTRSNDCELYDNDFSFLSGWGLGMYRSSRNVVAHNVFDYCVRGYSHDVYWRGQDSAGILMFERCSENLFVRNSATHGGDGVFLFGGQDAVAGRALARGEPRAGGSDRNIWFQNDFSFAVANGIEATFSSDNWAIENLLDGCHQHGVWGGYSRRMVVLKNQIRGTLGGAISIEHGQECALVQNEIQGGDLGLELWWDEDPDLVGGPFGREHDTSSRDHYVAQNRFADNARDLVLKRTTGVTLVGNTFANKAGDLKVEALAFEGEPPKAKSDPKLLLLDERGARPSGLVQESSVRVPGKRPEWVERALAWTVPKVPGKQVTFARERGEQQGLATIVMGEWGPWDFRSDEPRPKPRASGGLLSETRWQARWFRWTEASDPRGDLAAWRKLADEPLSRAEVGVWVHPTANLPELKRELGNRHYGLIASSTFTLETAGTYALSVISDDGVRVAIDGQVVIENWTWHAAARDEARLELAAGEHTIELEYFQIDGAVALSLELSQL